MCRGKGLLKVGRFVWEDDLCLWQGHIEGCPLGRNLEDCCCRPEQEIVARGFDPYTFFDPKSSF
jgi:hypothetical protein